MYMISLKDYRFREPGGDSNAAYIRMIDLLLQGISMHAVEGDKADYERFRSDIDQIATTLGARTPFPELLVMAGEAVRAMEDYNRRTDKFIRQQKEGLQTMLSMLTKSVITV